MPPEGVSAACAAKQGVLERYGVETVGSFEGVLQRYGGGNSPLGGGAQRPRERAAFLRGNVALLVERIARERRAFCARSIFVGEHRSRRQSARQRGKILSAVFGNIGMGRAIRCSESPLDEAFEWEGGAYPSLFVVEAIVRSWCLRCIAWPIPTMLSVLRRAAAVVMVSLLPGKGK